MNKEQQLAINPAIMENTEGLLAWKQVLRPTIK